MGEVDPIKPIVEEYCGTGLIGDFVGWVTNRLPKVSPLDVCYYATKPGAYEYFCCHTTDPYVPTYQLLELISTLLRSREVCLFMPIRRTGGCRALSNKGAPQRRYIRQLHCSDLANAISVYLRLISGRIHFSKAAINRSMHSANSVLTLSQS